MSPPAEQKRIPLRIKLPFASAEEFVARYGMNVAPGGLFISTKSTRPEGTLVSFEVVLADGTRLMRGEGTVQRVVTDEATGRTGMLVRFTRIDAQTRALIDQVVAARTGVPAAAEPALPPSGPLPPLPAAPPSAPRAPSQASLPAVPAAAPASAPRAPSQPALPVVPPVAPVSRAPSQPTLPVVPPVAPDSTPELGARAVAAPIAPPERTPPIPPHAPEPGTATPPLPARAAPTDPLAPPPVPLSPPPARREAAPAVTPPLPTRGGTAAAPPVQIGSPDFTPAMTPPLPARNAVSAPPPPPSRLEAEPLTTPPLPGRAVAPAAEPKTQPSAPAAARAVEAPPPPAQPEPVVPVAAVQLPPGEEVVLGIDLGTTTCRVAVFVEGAPRLVPIAAERGIALPSVVAYDKVRDAMLVGSPAKRHAVDFPDQAALGFKRLLGRRARSKKVQELAKRFAFPVVADPEGDAGVELAGRVFGVPELTALLLAELKNAAQEYVGRPVTRAVLCVPAWCNDYQRGAVLEAGRRAGLQVLRVLNEPSAVALAFGFGRGLARKRVLVYDLGGGTFDASVVEITGDDLDVVSTGGDAFLGGLDFDYRLAEALVAPLPDGPRERLFASRVVVERVRDACEAAKIALSEQETALVNVPFASTDDAGGPVDLRSEVHREFLEQNTADLVERTVQVTKVVLEAARLTPQALDEVLVVGGQSRAPLVRRAIEAFLGKSARTDVDAQGAVALGAAVLGRSLLLAERGKKGPSLSEVLSAPIGVAVRGGGMRRVLERNTRLPAEKSLMVPVKQGEPTRLAVFQGTAAQADENEYLGALSFVPDKTGELAVRFSVSPDGRLALTAISPSGRPSDASFATADAGDEVRATLLAAAPLPGDEPATTGKQGLLGGFKRLFGRS